jgi:spoIIIJ-associated protein
MNNNKPALDQARQILENLLGFLGFFVTIEEEDGTDGPTLQILTEEHERLIGPRGQVLDDIQYLVNRLLCRRMEDAPRIRVDCEFYRNMREDKMLARAKEMAEGVRLSGVSAVLSPMNSYYRRLIHNAFVSDPDVMTESAKGDARFKRMFLKKRPKA